MSAWESVAAALDGGDRVIDIWWRDDDAGRDTPQLAALLALARSLEVPVVLAVVPEWLEPAAVRRILDCPWATVIQHGIAHRDHSRAGEKKIELGGTCDRELTETGLGAGRALLARAFGDRFVPAMAPPWNRITPDLAAALPKMGFTGLSLFGPTAKGPDITGLRLASTHLDPIAWKGERGMRPEADLVQELAALVAEPPDEAVGILTHHLVTDDAGLAVLGRLLGLLHVHPRVRFRSASSLLGHPS